MYICYSFYQLCDVARVDALSLRIIAEAREVSVVKKQVAVCVAPVAPRAPDFLHVGFHASGAVEVHHATHILLVNTHAKGDSGNDYAEVAAHESGLDALPIAR